MAERISDVFKDYCYSCHNKTPQKLIAYNKFSNPVYECMSCGSFAVDKINEEFHHEEEHS
jgi:uncharacterized Zn finger protein